VDEANMKYLMNYALMIVLASFSSFAAEVPPSALSKSADNKTLDLLVQFDDDAIQAEAARQRERQNATFESQETTERKAMRFAALKQAIHSDPSLQGAEVLIDYSHLPMQFIRFHSSDALRTWSRDTRIRALFNDEVVRASQSPGWNLIKIGQPATAASGMTGTGGTVAVIDTGTDYRHVDFGPCTAIGVPATCKVIASLDWINDGQLDANGHGTNVAGIVVGVAPGAKIASLKVLDAAGSGSSSNILAAVNWAIANRTNYNIVAINLSLGVHGVKYTAPCSSAYAAPFANAKAAGILVAVASGNDGYIDGIESPACTPGAVSVGNTTDTDAVNPSSNSASFLTILAPGTSICAAGHCYSGTSQASPHVAAAAAILRMRYPDETIQQITSRMTSYGVPVTDVRNGIVKTRLDLWDASRPPPPMPTFMRAESALPFLPSQVSPGVAADFNGDGWPDVALKRGLIPSIDVVLNVDGVLSEVHTTAGGGETMGGTDSMLAGDFNRDGRMDLAISSPQDRDIFVLFGDGIGGFSTSLAPLSIGSEVLSIKSGDLNEDGILDLVTSHYQKGVPVPEVSFVLWIGKPDGTFEMFNQQYLSAGWSAGYLALGDFNGDGHLDVALNHNNCNVSVFFGMGSGLFLPRLAVPYCGGGSAPGIGADDINDDGISDLILSGPDYPGTDDGAIVLLLGNQSGIFSSPKYLPVYAHRTVDAVLRIVDINGDGLKDIVSPRDTNRPLIILLRRATGGYHSPIETSDIPSAGKYVLFADFNRDGKLDVVAMAYDGRYTREMYMNTTAGSPIFRNGFEYGESSNWSERIPTQR